MKGNSYIYIYIRPEVSALFSFQIVNRDLTLRPKWPRSAVLIFFSFGNKTRAGDSNQDGTCINLFFTKRTEIH